MYETLQKNLVSTSTVTRLCPYISRLFSCRQPIFTMRALQKLVALNLFVDPSHEDPDNSDVVHEQILTTRVYIFLLTTTVLIISLFTMLRPISAFETVSKPTLDTYLRLETMHSSTLACLCRQPVVTYASFFSIEPVYHAVSILSTHDHKNQRVFMHLILLDLLQ